MKIYRDYTTDDVILNEPCDIEGCGKVYPILLKDYKKFLKHGYMFPYNYKHFKLKNSKELLKTIILIGSHVNGSTVDDDLLSVQRVISELETAFSMAFRCEVRHKINDNGFSFESKNKEVFIDDKNYNNVRVVMLRQNAIEEPKIYDDPEVQEWVNRYNSSIKTDVTLGDMIISVSCSTGKTYEDIRNQNVLQFLSDYHRTAHVEKFRAMNLFRTVSDKVPNVEYMKSVITEIYRDKSSDMFTTLGNLEKMV